MKRPAAVYILLALHLFLGVNGLAGGALLMIRPDGALLGMKEDWLGHAPFANFFIPGLLLFLLNGVWPMLVIFGLTRRREKMRRLVFNAYPALHWGWTYSLYSGLITMGWIIIQQFMTQYFWIQPVILTVGLLILIFTLIPGVMNYYRIAAN